jgi:hypothetical protein
LSVRSIVLVSIVVIIGIVLAVLLLGGFLGGGRGIASYTSRTTSSISNTTTTIGTIQTTRTTIASPVETTSYSTSTVTSTITGTLTSLPKPTSRLIILRVPRSKYVIIYDEWVSYNSGDYSLIKAYWDKYVSLMRDEILKLYRNANIVNISITCFDSNHTIKIGFLVTNKVWSNGEVTADFLWFLNAWSLDFIDNKFSEHNDGLSWSGVLGGVETTIIVKVPPQPGPYKAWSSPYGHCHGHIWWPKK